MRAGDPGAGDELLRRFCGRLECLARKMLRRFPRCSAGPRPMTSCKTPCSGCCAPCERWHRRRSASSSAWPPSKCAGSCSTWSGTSMVPWGSEPTTKARAAFRKPLASSRPCPPRKTTRTWRRWQAFHEGVEGLPAEEREVVNLIFYHGWTQIEVAHLFESSERTIRRRWESALVKLHQRLKLPGQQT